MKFVDIPAEAEAQRPWLKKITIGPPPDAEEGTIGSLPALIGNQSDEDGEYPVIRICAELEDGDLMALANGEKIWIELWQSVMYPISISVGRT